MLISAVFWFVTERQEVLAEEARLLETGEVVAGTVYEVIVTRRSDTVRYFYYAGSYRYEDSDSMTRPPHEGDRLWVLHNPENHTESMILIKPEHLARVRERTGRNFPDRPPPVARPRSDTPSTAIPEPDRPPPDPASVLDSSETPVWEREP